LGPLSLERVRKLIEKKHIVGGEQVRVLPSREWVALETVTELRALMGGSDAAAELVLEQPIPPLSKPEPSSLEPLVASAARHEEQIPEVSAQEALSRPSAAEEDERTQVLGSLESSTHGPDDERTIVADLSLDSSPSLIPDLAPGNEPVNLRDDGPFTAALPEPIGRPLGPDVSGEKTIILDPEALTQLPDPSRPAPILRPSLIGGSHQRVQILRWMVVVLGFTALINEYFNPTPPEKPPFRLKPFECVLTASAKKSDIDKSNKAYVEGMSHYQKDNVERLRKAAARFQLAISLNKENLPAKAFFLSTCLNLAEFAKKDEKFAAALLTLSEEIKAQLSQGSSYVAGLIAQVEYYLFNGKQAAALHEIRTYSDNMIRIGAAADQVYVDRLRALALLKNGEAQAASILLQKYPDQQIDDPRFFHLRGMVYEVLGGIDEAVSEYRKALALQPSHAKSMLRLAELYIKKGGYGDAGPLLNYLISHPEELTPAEIGRSWFLESRLNLAFERIKQAVNAIEKAIKFDPGNREYILESYRQKARLKDLTPAMQREAKMYFHIMEANRHLSEGEPEIAKATYIQASLDNPDSEIPYVELGDLLMRQRRTAEARNAYRNAILRNKKDVNLVSKYIHSLIETYDFEEAEKQMDQLRKRDVPQSAVDKAAGDLSQRREQYDLAQGYYRSALSRAYVDPAVYVAYGKSLLITRHYKAAELNFTLALREDPLNVEAIIGIAQTVKETEGPTGGIENAIRYLEEQLSKLGGRAGAGAGAGQIYTAIAQLELDRKSLDRAKERLREAFSKDPGLSDPWKVMAAILTDEYRSMPVTDNSSRAKKLKRREEAIAAYRSYSERAPSDPSGYFEVFKLHFYSSSGNETGFILDARRELMMIKGTAPNYPRLNYSFGLCDMKLNEFQSALAHFDAELKAYPENLDALLAKGNVYRKMGRLTDARAVLAEAMKYRPDSFDAKMLAGDVAFDEARYQVALTLYTLAAQQNRGSAEIHEKLSKTYFKLGDRVSADRSAQEAKRQRGE